MILFRDLNSENKKLLTRISVFSKSPQVRSRAKCIILLERGFSIPQLMKIFGVSRKTIYNWLTKWEEQGFLGLYNQKGRGRKPKLSSWQKETVKEWVKQEPKSLKKVVARVDREWSIELSKETIKRIIKKLKMKWERMTRGLSKTPESWKLEFKIPQLLKLKEQELKGEIDLRYTDSGLLRVVDRIVKM